MVASLLLARPPHRGLPASPPPPWSLPQALLPILWCHLPFRPRPHPAGSLSQAPPESPGSSPSRSSSDPRGSFYTQSCSCACPAHSPLGASRTISQPFNSALEMLPFISAQAQLPLPRIPSPGAPWQTPTHPATPNSNIPSSRRT